MLGWGRRAAPSGPGRRQGEAPLPGVCRVVPSTVARLQEQVLAVVGGRDGRLCTTLLARGCWCGGAAQSVPPASAGVGLATTDTDRHPVSHGSGGLLLVVPRGHDCPTP